MAMTETIGESRDTGAPLAGRLRRSFEWKVVWLCLLTTICALAFTFAAFQWQDWQTDRADLAVDQLSMAQKIAAEAVLAERRGAQRRTPGPRGLVLAFRQAPRSAPLDARR
jgi:hypothetical protein